MFGSIQGLPAGHQVVGHAPLALHSAMERPPDLLDGASACSVLQGPLLFDHRRIRQRKDLFTKVAKVSVAKKGHI